MLNNVEVGASDLIADDIQRGRDVGDPTYNQMRVALGEKPVTSFSQITSSAALQQELQQIYGNVNNVELFVGLMGEDHLPGSSLGPTEQSLLAKQFEALRDGDRFYYQNADPASLVNQLNNTTLAQIIERNTMLTNLQSNVFFFYSNVQGTVTTGGAWGGFFGHNRSQPMPVPGATVEVIQDGQVIATTTTTAAGAYQFQQIGSGQFTLKVLPPSSGPFSNLASATTTLDITKGQAGPNSAAVESFSLSQSGWPWRAASTTANAVLTTPSATPSGSSSGSVESRALAAVVASATTKASTAAAAVDQVFAQDDLQQFARSLMHCTIGSATGTWKVLRSQGPKAARLARSVFADTPVTGRA